jgi:hypothetical protein
MNRRVWLLVAALAALSLAMGTGGFSAAELDRGVSVSVAEDEHAFVGLADPGAHGEGAYWMPPKHNGETPVTKNDQTTRLFVVRNAFTNEQIRVTAHGGGDSAATLLHAETEWVGAITGPEAVNGTVECPGPPNNGPTQLDLTVVVDGSDGGLHAKIEYPVTVVCAVGNGSTRAGNAPT